MEERLSRRIVGHSIPEYMIEILIQDYAGPFLRMVVSRTGVSTTCPTSRTATGAAWRSAFLLPRNSVCWSFCTT